MKTQNKILQSIVIFAAVLLTAGCGGQSKQVEATLREAGDNRAGLEYVLAHYADDTEKLAAARFLIANMTHYFGFEGAELDSVEALLKPLMTYKMNFTIGDRARKKWGGFDFSVLRKTRDARKVDAQYLINNIDMAFEQWKSKPWNKDLPFCDFCELILPYRIGNERITDWRATYLRKYGAMLDSLYTGDDAVEACKILNHIITDQERRIYNSELSCPHRDALSLLECRVGTCRDDCDRLTYAMRACGIPVACDHILVDPKNGASHQWMVVRDNKTGRFIPFGYDGMVPDRDLRPQDSRLKGKVHRQIFDGAAYKDVTAEYFGANRVEIPIEGEPDRVRLAVFARGRWLAIDKGVLKGGKVVFENIEPGLFYVPMAEENGTLVPCGEAFTIENNDTHIFHADATHSHSVQLTRKMPLTERLVKWMTDDVDGMRIKVSRSESFSSAKEVAHVVTGFSGNYNRFDVACSDKEWSFIQLSLPSGKRMHLAELQAYSDTALTMPIQLAVATEMDTQYGPQYLVDGDILTNFTAAADMNEIVLRMNTPSQISSIVVVPHNDDNFVWKGDEYELFCFCGAMGWKSFGKKTAAGGSIVFQVPDNALLWLHDCTKGREEMPFVMRGGAQLFSVKPSK